MKVKINESGILLDKDIMQIIGDEGYKKALLSYDGGENIEVVFVKNLGNTGSMKEILAELGILCLIIKDENTPYISAGQFVERYELPIGEKQYDLINQRESDPLVDKSYFVIKLENK